MRTLVACAALAGAIALAGCPASKSSRCKLLCQQELECMESEGREDIVIDENECTSACTVLERDGEGKKHVESYARCVAEAKTCAEKLECR